LPPAIDSKQVEIWFQDEARVGQRGTTSRIWAPKGTRPRIVQQQQFISAYLFGAVCPAKKKGAGIVMPKANTEAMQHHLEVISVTVEKNCHALIVTDGAAWHSTPKLLIPKNITLLVLPPYSPELNPVEQIWQQLRKSHFSNRCFKGYEEIVEVCCQAWNAFTEAPDLIQSLCSRKWAILE
jgi:hypothetical protein